MRPDPRLQRLDPRTRLGAHVPLPLVGDVEVAQQHRGGDHADAFVAEQERPVLAREQGLRQAYPPEIAAEKERASETSAVLSIKSANAPSDARDTEVRASHGRA